MPEQEKKSTFDLYAEMAEELFAIPDIQDPQRAQLYSQLADGMTRLWLLMTDAEVERARELVSRYHKKEARSRGYAADAIAGLCAEADARAIAALEAEARGGECAPKECCSASYKLFVEQLNARVRALEEQVRRLERRGGRPASYGPIKPFLPVKPVKNPNAKPGPQPRPCKCGSCRKP